MPSKVKFGCEHPDPVVETASLSSVEPVDVHYELKIPTSVVENGKLSALQVESIIYASQAHNCILPNGHRAGFLIGNYNIIFNFYMQNILNLTSNHLKITKQQEGIIC